MATEEEEKAAMERFRSHKKTVVEFPFAPLVRSELGSLSFARVQPRFEFLRMLLTRVDDPFPDLLPWKLLSDLNDHLNGVLLFLNEASAFRLDEEVSGQPPKQRREAMIERFTRAFDSLVPVLWPPSLHSVFEGSQLQAQVASAKFVADQALQAAEKLKRLEEETAGVLKTLKEQAAKTGTDKYAETFKALADQFRDVAKVWLVALLVSVGAVVAFGVWLLKSASEASPSIPVPSLVTHIAGRVAILSAVVYLLGWTARNYRASRHNEVVNRHREIALRTLDVFRDAARDEATKDAVLLRTTEAIFQHQGSGYQSSDAEPAPASNTIVEILRRGTGDKG